MTTRDGIRNNRIETARATRPMFDSPRRENVDLMFCIDQLSDQPVLRFVG